MSKVKPNCSLNSSNGFQFDQYVVEVSYMPQHLENYWSIHQFLFFFLTWNRHFWVQGSTGGEKLAKLWSSNSETICFPHLLLTAKFTTLTCVLVHSISGKGPSWRPLPVGFSSSWPFWKYIETSTQNTFQTQIFYCLCIWCLVVWVCFPGCFLGKWAHLFPWSCKFVLIHAELPRGFITKNKLAFDYIVLKMWVHIIDYKYLWISYLSLKEEQASYVYFTRINTVLLYLGLVLVCNIYQSQVIISKWSKKATRNK